MSTNVNTEMSLLISARPEIKDFRLELSAASNQPSAQQYAITYPLLKADS
jgi:hypothetical protein